MSVKVKEQTVSRTLAAVSKALVVLNSSGHRDSGVCRYQYQHCLVCNRSQRPTLK